MLTISTIIYKLSNTIQICCIMLRHCNATAKDLESVAEPEPVGAGLFFSEAEPIFKIKGCSGSAQKMF